MSAPELVVLEVAGTSLADTLYTGGAEGFPLSAVVCGLCTRLVRALTGTYKAIEWITLSGNPGWRDAAAQVSRHDRAGQSHGPPAKLGGAMNGYAARAIAFYLPQFHPIPENDEWWGPGFTEWTNTARARPLFPGHRQPDLPADLGFYDLRLPQVREAQAELALKYGVEAFCYWHYWFGDGRQILQMPLQEVLLTGQPAISFCLGWANQTWTGTWHGASDRILIEQRYPGPDDERAHFHTLVSAFHDERYLRVDGRPVFYVFRPEELPDARGFVDRWQAMARTVGLNGLYLVAEVSDLLGAGPKYTRVAEDGFDAGVYVRMPAQVDRWTTSCMRAGRKLMRWPERYPYGTLTAPLPTGLDQRIHQPSVYPNWDNTPRCGRRGLVLTGSEPERFRPHVRTAVDQLADRPEQQRLLWVKSWNEWAEGNHLEPDLRHGHSWLRVLHEELSRA